MRQERNNMSDDILNDPTDDVTKGNLSGWIEKPHISKEDLFRKEIAEMQKLFTAWGAPYVHLVSK